MHSLINARRRVRAPAWTAVLFLCLSPALAPAQPGVLAVPPAQAQHVLEQYVDALRRGDAAGVREALGCGLLAKRRAALARPEFGERIAQVYGPLRMELISYRMISRDRIWLEAVFMHPDGRSEGRRFLLQRLPSRAGTGFVVCAEAQNPRTEFAALELAPPPSPRAGAARYLMPPTPGPSYARSRPDSVESIGNMMGREPQPPSILP